MPNKTTNYKLSKPLESEFYSVEVQNNNMDILDGVLIALDESISTKVDKISGKSLSTNDYTDSDKAAVATIADKLNLPLYDVGNIDANTLTTPGIYAVSCAGPQNFPFADSDAMPLLIVAEAGRMPDISSGSPDFSNAKTLLQICIGKGGEVYSRYKIAGDGDLSAWSWSSWSTKAVSVTNSLGSGSTTAALSAAQGKALDEKKVDKMSGKGLSTNDYTDAEKNKVASAISETDAKAAFAAKGKLTDCHSFGNPGIYSIPYNAANLPAGVSFSSDRNATLLVTYSANTSWTNYEHSLTLILPDGQIYTQQCMGSNDTASFTTWVKAYDSFLDNAATLHGEATAYQFVLGAGGKKILTNNNYLVSGISENTSDTDIPNVQAVKKLNEKKQDKAWQTLGSLTVAEGEEAASIKIAMPAALATCNELMLEVEFYVGSDKTSQWLPTFFLSDAGRVAYDSWLAGGGTASVTAGKKYYFVAHSRVGEDYVLTTFGQGSEHIHGNSRAAAYTARTNTNYRKNMQSYPAYLYCEIAGGNSFAAGTKIKLLGR